MTCSNIKDIKYNYRPYCHDIHSSVFLACSDINKRKEEYTPQFNHELVLFFESGEAITLTNDDFCDIYKSMNSGLTKVIGFFMDGYLDTKLFSPEFCEKHVIKHLAKKYRLDLSEDKWII